jgi:hypothetical protein
MYLIEVLDLGNLIMHHRCHLIHVVRTGCTMQQVRDYTEQFNMVTHTNFVNSVILRPNWACMVTVAMKLNETQA